MSRDGNAPRGSLESLAVAGDCGAVEIDTAAHAPAPHIREIPTYGHREEHVAATARRAAPYLTAKEVVDRYGDSHVTIGLIMAKIEVCHRRSGIGVGVNIINLRSHTFYDIEFQSLLGRIAGCVPHPQSKRM